MEIRDVKIGDEVVGEYGEDGIVVWVDWMNDKIGVYDGKEAWGGDIDEYELKKYPA